MSTVLITGANRGIGLELARQLHKRGDSVIAVCREESPELTALGVRVEPGIDVTSDAAVATLVGRLAGQKLDIVINNAGILANDRLDALDLDSVRRQLEVNSIAPLRVTHALLPLLGPGSKIAIMTSMMGSIGDNQMGSWYGYRMSKAAVNIAGVSLARDLQPRQIAVILLHPGLVQTRMTGFSGKVTAEEAATGLIKQIDALELSTSGSFVHANGRSLPW